MIYTIQDLREGKVAIDYTKNVDLDRLKKVLQEAFPLGSKNILGMSNFYGKRETDRETDWKCWNRKEYSILPKQTVDKFVLKDEFILPEKWCIKSGDQRVVDYCNKYGVFKNSYKEGECSRNYAHFPSYSGATTNSTIAENYIEITLDQFIKYVLKQNTMDNKEIIGYKLKDKSFLEFANKIDDYNDDQEFGFIYSFKCSQYSLNNFTKAGVLDLWFEPVYCEKEEKIMIDKYEVIIENKDMTYIDGYQFTREFWQSAKVVSENSKAMVKIGCSHQFNLDKETIDKVLKRLNDFK